MFLSSVEQSGCGLSYMYLFTLEAFASCSITTTQGLKQFFRVYTGTVGVISYITHNYV